MRVLLCDAESCLIIVSLCYFLTTQLGDVSSLHVNYNVIHLDSGSTFCRLQCDTRT